MAARQQLSQSMRARASVMGSTGRFWSAADLPGPASTRHHLLTELERDGELLHVRRDLYWRGHKTPLGMSPPPPDALVEKLVGKRGVGPAGLSAAHRLRLSTQVPRQAQVAVPERPPTSSGSASVLFVSRASRSKRKSASLTSDEVALLEALEGWNRIIEVPLTQAWFRLREMLGEEHVSPNRLAKASGTEPAMVRVRLAALLLQAGYAEAASKVPPADPRTVRQALPRELAAARA